MNWKIERRDFKWLGPLSKETSSAGVLVAVEPAAAPRVDVSAAHFLFIFDASAGAVPNEGSMAAVEWLMNSSSELVVANCMSAATGKG